jgi:DNA-binding MarR family transcriptional regulator
VGEQAPTDEGRELEGIELEAWTIFPASHVPYRLLLLAKMLDRLIAVQLREIAGLTLAEWRVMAHLAVMGKKTASAIASAAFVDRAEVSRAVAALEDRDLLGRHANPRNRKSPLLILTDRGIELHRRVQEQRQQFFAEMTADLGPEELGLMDKWLLKMALRASRRFSEPD